MCKTTTGAWCTPAVGHRPKKDGFREAGGRPRWLLWHDGRKRLNYKPGSLPFLEMRAPYSTDRPTGVIHAEVDRRLS